MANINENTARIPPPPHHRIPTVPTNRATGTTRASTQYLLPYNSNPSTQHLNGMAPPHVPKHITTLHPYRTLLQTISVPCHYPNHRRPLITSPLVFGGTVHPRRPNIRAWPRNIDTAIQPFTLTPTAAQWRRSRPPNMDHNGTAIFRNTQGTGENICAYYTILWWASWGWHSNHITYAHLSSVTPQEYTTPPSGGIMTPMLVHHFDEASIQKGYDPRYTPIPM